MKTIISALHRTLRDTFRSERSKKIREEAREIVGREEANWLFLMKKKKAVLVIYPALVFVVVLMTDTKERRENYIHTPMKGSMKNTKELLTEERIVGKQNSWRYLKYFRR